MRLHQPGLARPSQGRTLLFVLAAAGVFCSFAALGSPTPAHAQPSQVALTVSYSIIGGGGIDAQDILTYFTGGSQVTSVISGSPTAYMVDAGSQWSVLTALNGSSSNERWTTAQDVGGTISAPLTESFTYYHQYLMNFMYNITNGGTGYSPPSVSYTSMGSSASSPAGVAAWVDASATYTYASELPGSNANERWILSQTETTYTGLVSGPTSVDLDYYHQFAVTSSYSIANAGSDSPSAPILSSTAFEAPALVPLSASPQVDWFDSGAPVSFTSTLTGGLSTKGTERWIGTVEQQTQAGTVLSFDTNSTVVGPLSITPVFYHQFLVDVAFDYIGGNSTGLELPQFLYQSFGSQVFVNSTSQVWVDADTQYILPANICCQSNPAIERWVLNNSTTGAINFPTEINPVYFHEYMETFSYSIVGAQPPSPSSQPVLTYLIQDDAQHITLTAAPQSFWADNGSAYSTEAALPGGTSSERWFASLAVGDMIGPPGNAVVVAYGQQYLLAFVGGGQLSEWVDAGTNSTIQAPGVYGREEGTGQRVVAYRIDSGNEVDVTAPVFELAIPISMEGPHTITFQTVPQFEVSLDANATAAISSITPPTIQGDNYWYDQGSSVQVVLNTVWGRSDGVGNRMTSVTATNQAPIEVDALGTVEAYSTSSINTPISITTGSIRQYEVVLDQGAQAAFATVSPPSSLPTDTFWYDSGSPAVTVILDGIYSRSSGTGYRVTTWELGTGTLNSVATTGEITIVTKAMDSAQSINVSVVEQYQVSLDKGGSTMLYSMSSPSIPQDTGWYDASTPVGVVMDGILGRASGTGQRLAAYSLNEGADTAVASTGLVYVLNLTKISSPESIETSVVTQYQLTLDGGATSALYSMTPTPIPQDKYWYDGGTAVAVYLNGGWGRTATSGSRLVSYSANKGASTSVLSSSPVEVLSLAAISSPQSITTKTVAQYHLASPFAPNSMTNSTIPGDAPGWFDTGTPVKAVYSEAWNQTAGSRNLVTSYSVDAGAKTNVSPTTSGTFTVSLTMSQAHTITVTSIAQYLLTVVGPSKVTATPPSPTGDSYFDSGAKETFTIPTMWNATSEAGAREMLTSYSIDGAPEVAVPESNSSTTFTTPTLTFTSAKTIVCGAVSQYQVGFDFFNNVGAVPVQPSLVQIGVGNSTVYVNGTSTWLTNGTSFRLVEVIWEGASVGPTPAPSYVVKASPLNVTLDTQVYDASLKVVDLLGLPVSGAQVSVTLDNGSVISGTTNGQGRFAIGMIPLGTYTAKVSSLGMSTRIVGNSATKPLAQGKVLLSLISLLALAAGAAGAAALAVVLVRKRKRGKKADGQVSAPK